MDMRYLATEALSGLNVRINPMYLPEDHKVILPAADVDALTRAVNTAKVQPVESGRIRTLLGVGRGRNRATDCELSERDAQLLASAIRFLGIAIERDRKISRGQYAGPMSGAEAMKYVRARHGLH